MMAARKRSGFSKLFWLLAALPHLLSAQTALTLSTAPNPSKFGAPVVLTATITPPTATGRVTFYDGVTVLGTAPIVSGKASISTISLPAANTLLPGGSRKLRALYLGSSSTPTVVSNQVSQTVVAQPGSRFAAGSATPILPSTSVVVADFNGDGRADIAVGEANESLRVLLGNGDGTFVLAFTYSGPFHVNPTALAVGDFNGDGKPDLAVQDSGNGLLNILLGNGDGTFQSGNLYSIPSSTAGLSSLAVGDFNGDGKADLAVANQSLAILMGNGDGTFQPMLSIPGGPTPIFVVVGDFNADGRADLATASFSTKAVNVLLGNGNGTFQTPVSYPIPEKAVSLAVADFNQDGYSDLVTANPDSTQTVSNTISNSVSILLSTGASGAFQPAVSYPSGLNPLSVSVGDFNGDGVTDIVVGNAGSQNVGVLLGRFDGSFQAVIGLPIGLRPFALAVGDFNGDGKADLALAAQTTDATQFYMDVVLGTNINVTATAGTPQSAVIGTAFLTPLQVLVQDGATPLSGITVTFTSPTSGPGAVLSSPTAVTNASGVASVTAIANGTGGSYTVTGSYQGLSGSFSLTNLVGPPSVLAVSPTALQSAALGTPFPKPLKVTLTDSAGNPASGVTVTFAAPTSGASAVLSNGTVVTNAAGVASVTATANVTAGAYTVTASAAGLTNTFLLSNVAPTNVSLTTSVNPSNFGAPLTLTATVSPAGATGRVMFFDGVTVLGSKPLSSGTASIFTTLLPAGNRRLTAFYSGDANFIAATSNAINQTVKALGGAGFLAGNPINIAPSAPTSVVVGDFNGDGKADIAFPGGRTGPNTVTVALGKGDGTFQTPAGFAVGVGPTAVAVVDFNADGIADLAVTNFASNNVSILLGNGDGTFAPAVNYPAGSTGPIALAVADFNSDGKADLVIAGASVTILPGNGDGTFGSPVNLPGLTGPSSIVVADFNGDGKADLGVWVLSNANLQVLLGNGDGTFQAATASFTLSTGLSALLTAADFNGDGKTDLSVVSAAGNFIVLGVGDGTFQPPISQASPGTVVGDFNGDGILDLAGSVGNSLFDELGNGDGTFQTATSFLSPTQPLGLAVADFNGDGMADIVTANFNGGVANGGTVTVFLGIQGGVILTPSPGSTPQNTLTGTAFAAPLEVRVLSNGSAAAGVTVTFAAPPVGASATLSSPTAVTNASGLASVTATANGTPGSYVVTANYLGVSANFTLTNTGVTNLTATGGTPQSTLVNAAFPSALQATVKDSSGNPVVGVTVTFAAPPSGASAVLSSQTAVTNASGVASVTATANNIAGSYTITAGVGTLSVAFSLTNSAAPPASITATGGSLQSALLGAAFPSALQAVVKDANGLPVSGATVTFTVPSTGASAVLSSATATSNVFGVASVNATANNIAGAYTVTASVGTLSATYSLTNLLGGGSNLALGRNATQSSTLPGYLTAGPAGAVDGNTDGNFADGSVTVTNADPNAWWQVDLGASASISSVVVWNRTDCCSSRLTDFWVFVSNTPFLPTDTPTTLQNRAGTFASHQTSAPNPSTTITVNGAQGQYVRVQLTGTDYLSLAEVQVMGTGVTPPSTNLSKGKAATQSSTFPGNPTDVAASAVDGNTDGNFANGSVTATNADPNAWWQVDLGVSATVNSVVVWNRTDCCSSRLNDFWVFISNTPFLATDTPTSLQSRAGTFASHQTSAPSPSTTITANVQGRYVRVQLTGANNLSLAEVQVLGTAPPVTNLSQGKFATQSSTLTGYPTAVASAAVDGNTDGAFNNGSVTATSADSNAWWQVDLGASAAVSSIVIWNRTDCCNSRLSDYWVFVSDTPFLATDTPTTLQGRAGTFASHQTTTPNPSTTITANAQGRYVRVQLTGTNYLSLAEVQVFGIGGAVVVSNVAQGKLTSQSSTLPGYPTSGAASAVDGNTDGNFANGSVTATSLDPNPWWQVDLGASTAVSSIVIWNRTDCCSSRLGDYWVFVSDTPFGLNDTPTTLQNRAGTFASHQTSAPNPSTTIAANAQGRYVRVQLSIANYLSLAEVQVFGQ